DGIAAAWQCFDCRRRILSRWLQDCIHIRRFKPGRGRYEWRLGCFRQGFDNGRDHPCLDDVDWPTADRRTILPAARSLDGTTPAFGSYATNLAPGATDGFNDIFIKDVVNSSGQVISNGAVQQITINAGVEGDGNSFFPHFSSDGTKLVFQSVATNLVAGD